MYSNPEVFCGGWVGNERLDTNLFVVKAGGSVLSCSKDYRVVARLVKNYIDGGKKVVLVVSAAKGVTDDLVRAYEEQDSSLISRVIDRYKSIMSELDIMNPSVQNSVEALCRDLMNIFNAFITLKLWDARIRDLILSFGEKISAYIMAGALENEGVNAIPAYGRAAGIVTDSRFSEANPLPQAESMVRERVLRVLERGFTPVIAGFIGETIDGLTTTLGRGGSDYTATFIAKSIGASEVHLITDVPGIMTGDPRLFRNAFTIPVLSYDEAIELAHLGGKKFHPRTFEPLRQTPIVTRVRKPGCDSETVIVKSWREPPLKAVALVRSLELVMVRGAGMVGRRGTAARVMSIARDAGVNIIAISQPVSETSINLVVNRGCGEKLSRGLEKLVGEGIIREYEVINDVEAVSVIGWGLRKPEVIGETLGLLKGHSIYMLAKGPMEVSLSVVAPKREAENIAYTMHDYIVERAGKHFLGGIV